jgi:cathepsin D
MGLVPAVGVGADGFPFRQLLDNSAQLSSPYMSFWLTRFSSDKFGGVDKPGGVFTLGGLRHEFIKGEVEFTTSFSDNTWNISLNGGAPSFLHLGGNKHSVLLRIER